MYSISGYVRMAALLSAAWILCGCGNGSGSGSQTYGRYGTLRFSAKTDRAAYAPGVIINVSFTISNIGSAPVSISADGIYTASSLVPIALIATQNGNTVTTITDNGGLEESLTLTPGETKTSIVTWDQVEETGTPLPPGQYTLYVVLAASRIDSASFSNLTYTLSAAPITIAISRAAV